MLILKQGAEKDRENSIKGQKDRVDIIKLLFYCEIDFEKYHQLLAKYNLDHFHSRLKNIIVNFKEINYLNLNPREFKMKKKEVIDKLRIH